VQSRPGRYHLKLPSFLAAYPTDWAVEYNWLCPQNKPDKPGLHHPHTSFVMAAMTAKVAAMSQADRHAFLIDGARMVLAGEDKHDVPGRERVRLYRSERVQPAGIVPKAA
jgi:hypothetical protein